MSNAYITWAKSVSGLKPADKLVLLLIADQVDESGTWQIAIGDIARDASQSQSTIRRALDRLAAEGLVVFRCETYRGNAQAAHRFRLVSSAGEMDRAAAEGFHRERTVLRRGPVKDTISTQSCKEGGSTVERRVLSTVKGHITPQNTPQNSSAKLRFPGSHGPDANCRGTGRSPQRRSQAAQPPPATLPVITKGTPQGEAYDQVDRAQGRVPYWPDSGRKTVRTEWPPPVELKDATNVAAELALIADRRSRR